MFVLFALKRSGCNKIILARLCSARCVRVRHECTLVRQLARNSGVSLVRREGGEEQDFVGTWVMISISLDRRWLDTMIQERRIFTACSCLLARSGRGQEWGTEAHFGKADGGQYPIKPRNL